MDASKTITKLQSLLVLINRLLAAAYVGVTFLVVRALVQQGASIIGGVVLIILALVLAYGHFMCKEWALKTSAGIFAVVNLIAVPYLLSPYEQGLVPTLQVRIGQFAIISLLTAVLVANYILYRRINKSGHVPR